MKAIGSKAELLKSLMAMEPSKTIRDDEFTTEDYVSAMRASGDKRTHNGLRLALRELAKNGHLKLRKVSLDGKECNAYSKP